MPEPSLPLWKAQVVWHAAANTIRNVGRPCRRLCLLVACILTAVCVEQDSLEVIRTVSSGVEIATPRALPPLLSEASRWGLRVLRTIETEPRPGEPPLIFNPTRVLPLADGAILVADGGGDLVLHVLGPDRGTVTSAFGRRGEGPGEMSGYPVLWEDAAGLIHVGDPSNRKTLTFARDGTLLDERPLPAASGSQISAHGDGELLAQRWTRREGGGVRPMLVKTDLARDTAQPFAGLPPLPPGESPGMNIQAGRPLWTTLGDRVVLGRSDVPAFKVHDREGALLWEIRLPLTRRTLTEPDIAEQRAKYGGIAARLSVGPIAITNGLFAFGDTAFAMFQSRLWRAAEDPPISERGRVWRLISVNGRPMGTVVWPEDVSPLWVGKGLAWVMAYDAVGRPVLQEVALEPPEGLAG